MAYRSCIIAPGPITGGWITVVGDSLVTCAGNVFTEDVTVFFVAEIAVVASVVVVVVGFEDVVVCCAVIVRASVVVDCTAVLIAGDTVAVVNRTLVVVGPPVFVASGTFVVCTDASCPVSDAMTYNYQSFVFFEFTRNHQQSCIVFYF